MSDWEDLITQWTTGQSIKKHGSWWWFICPNKPQKIGLFGRKSGVLFEFGYNWRFNHEWRFIGADSVYHISFKQDSTVSIIQTYFESISFFRTLIRTFLIEIGSHCIRVHEWTRQSSNSSIQKKQEGEEGMFSSRSSNSKGTF